jgi:hypothetical protein
LVQFGYQLGHCTGMLLVGGGGLDCGGEPLHVVGGIEVVCFGGALLHVVGGIEVVCLGGELLHVVGGGEVVCLGGVLYVVGGAEVVCLGGVVLCVVDDGGVYPGTVEPGGGTVPVPP